MKKKHFYSHLVNVTDLTLQIAELDVTSNERVHLLSLTEANIHSSVVSTVLDELPKEDKKIFLSNITEDNHKKTWEHLNIRMKNAQVKIEKSIKKAIDELSEDVRQVKKPKSK